MTRLAVTALAALLVGPVGSGSSNLRPASDVILNQVGFAKP